MKTLIGGAVAAVIGVIGLAVWYKEFFQLLAGAVPIMLLLGGGLALYLGFDELKDTWQKDTDAEPEPASSPAAESEAEKYRRENEELKKEIEQLKAEE